MTNFPDPPSREDTWHVSLWVKQHMPKVLRFSKNSEDDALQFNICVVFNGRKYTAKRALPSFVKLRNDLLKEVSNCQNRSKQFGGTKETTCDDKNDFKLYSSVNCSKVSSGNNMIPHLPLGERSSSMLKDVEGRARAAVGFADGGF